MVSANISYFLLGIHSFTLRWIRVSHRPRGTVFASMHADTKSSVGYLTIILVLIGIKVRSKYQRLRPRIIINLERTVLQQSDSGRTMEISCGVTYFLKYATSKKLSGYVAFSRVVVSTKLFNKCILLSVCILFMKECPLNNNTTSQDSFCLLKSHHITICT